MDRYYEEDLIRIGIVGEFQRAAATGEAPHFTDEEEDFMDDYPDEDFDEIDGGSFL